MIDNSGLLNSVEITALQEYNAALLRDHDIDFRLVLESKNRIEEPFNSHANTLMEKLAKTTESTQGRMILLYIETRSDLEGIYTDIFSGYIQQQHMAYFFSEQRIQDGILAASEMIYKRARNASPGREFTAPKSVLAGGGGATINRGEVS